MGRPKGSRNKRPYRKRRVEPTGRTYKAHVNGLSVFGASADDAAQAKQLTGKIREQLLAADPVIATLAIGDLLGELHLVAKIVNGLPTAP